LVTPNNGETNRKKEDFRFAIIFHKSPEYKLSNLSPTAGVDTFTLLRRGRKSAGLYLVLTLAGDVLVLLGAFVVVERAVDGGADGTTDGFSHALDRCFR
jgi:hypothetical protein